ncbi:DDE-domain-containing protein [Choiromyces venosus 120613-1]|uniref:DDE-domain-containing protein n=1 Tax=Choiromyces venosus 120613-1 TaxID=1336337 RepID=A0A3N4JBB8_9PEZI|nr:DDE-domain-containing protein [Choiromyces venosus 120613-1]
MSEINSSKQRCGPRAKQISERELKQGDINRITKPERTYSQKQKLCVLAFLEHHQISLNDESNIYPIKYRRPTQNEASEWFQIPQRTISNWVQNRKTIEEVGENSKIKRREPTTISTHIQWPELEKQLYELSNICNLDETPIPFEYLAGKTYDITGQKTVWVKETRSGWDKRQASLVLCIFADGIPWVPPMIIFHGTGQRLGAEKLKYHLGVLIEFNPTAYMNDNLFENYITQHLVPVLGGRPTLFAMDLMGSHKTPAILDLLRSHDITPSLIPGGCTSLLQPLDISVNKPFKEMVRDFTDEKIFELESMEEFERWSVGDRRITTTFCVGDAFYKFHQEKAEIIWRVFRKVGLSLPIDGSADIELDIKGFTGLTIGNWRENFNSEHDMETIGEGEDNNEDIEYVNSIE